VTLEVVGSGKGSATIRNPTFICRVHGLFMNRLLMALFMLLPLEAFLFAGVLVYATRITAREFVL
jgi:hypothetical protein